MMAVFVVIVCKMSLCTYRQVDRLIAQVHTKVRTIAVVDDRTIDTAIMTGVFVVSFHTQKWSTQRLELRCAFDSSFILRQSAKRVK
jgi:hypothetical protein